MKRITRLVEWSFQFHTLYGQQNNRWRNKMKAFKALNKAGK
jgi:hypothetical protein